MKTRYGYVSNSSSSSYLVPRRVGGRINSIKLPKSIWKSIEKNHVDLDGHGIDLSCSDEWWLTEMVSDCLENYDEISGMPGAVQYLYGNDCPYGWYDEDSEKDYIVFKKNGDCFYVDAYDFIAHDGTSDIPEQVMIRDSVNKVLSDRSLNKTQKISLIEKIFDY